MNKFLILGTGADINDIDFSNIRGDLITAGVNRIYEKIIPNYFFVYDMPEFMPYMVQDEKAEKIKTIYTHPGQLNKYFQKGFSYKFNYNTYYDPEYIPSYTYNGIHYDCGHGSINYLIRMLNDHLYRDQKNIFYIAGVPLFEDIGHFYDDEGKTTSKQDVLDRFYNDFLRLHKRCYCMVSVMKKSKLNELLPIEDINIIYRS